MPIRTREVDLDGLLPIEYRERKPASAAPDEIAGAGTSGTADVSERYPLRLEVYEQVSEVDASRPQAWS